MVVGLHLPREPLTDDDVDRLFGALADATRRDIVRRVMQGDLSVSALARPYPMSFAAVQKHVAVLERAELVTKQRRGREQLVRGNVAALRRAGRLLDEVEALWQGRIDRVDALLADDRPDPRSPTTHPPTTQPPGTGATP